MQAAAYNARASTARRSSGSSAVATSKISRRLTFREAIARGGPRDRDDFIPNSHFGTSSRYARPGESVPRRTFEDSDAVGGIRAILIPRQDRGDAGQVIDVSDVASPEDRPARPHAPNRPAARGEQSPAVVNIDYPLGMAAYHHLTAVALGVEELRGVYIG